MKRNNNHVGDRQLMKKLLQIFCDTFHFVHRYYLISQTSQKLICFFYQNISTSTYSTNYQTRNIIGFINHRKTNIQILWNKTDSILFTKWTLNLILVSIDAACKCIIIFCILKTGYFHVTCRRRRRRKR